MLVFLQVGATALLSLAAVPLLRRQSGKRRASPGRPPSLGACWEPASSPPSVHSRFKFGRSKYTSASRVALLSTLEPVFAGLTSYLFVGERLGLRSLAGAALIFSGILIAELTGGTDEVSTKDAG